MGCGTLSKITDIQAIQDHRNMRGAQIKDSVSILFLGVANSGKSTLAKQIRVIYDVGFTEWERKRVKCVILAHINDSTSIVLKQLKASNQSNDEAYQKVVEGFYNEVPPSDLCSPNEKYPDFFLHAKTLWQYDFVKSRFNELRPSNLQVNSGGYFIEHLERFYNTGFAPTDQDIVNTRIVTSGIQETDFHFKGMNMKMIDVAGQRSERRKWIHCFDRVDYVIFCASLIDFEIEAEAGEEENAMVESLAVFESVINSPCFKEKPFVVYLTKADLLKGLVDTKVKLNINVGKHGNFVVTSYANALNLVKHLYRKQDLDKNRRIYFHVLQVTEASEVKRAFEESVDQVLHGGNVTSKQQLKVICHANQENTPT